VPDKISKENPINITKAMVIEKLRELIKNKDLSEYIL
jgi:ATP-dependent protease HslVU (ClpYQ) ATPase subunit